MNSGAYLQLDFNRGVSSTEATLGDKDSGGPVFLGPTTSNLIVGVTSFGLNSLCRGTDFAYRTDTVAVLTWIEATVAPTAWAQIAP